MKIEISFQKFKEVVALVDKVAGKHMTLPVLSCVLIETKKNMATFKATNLDIGVEVSVPVKSDMDGSVAVPASIIGSFVSQISDQNQVVSLELSSGNLLVTSLRSKVVIKTLPPDDFPSIPQVSDGQEINIAAETFIKGLKSVWYSSSVSNVKPELSSVYIYNDNSNLVFVATDSFRLAEKKIKISSSLKFGDLLIPFKNTAGIIQLLEHMDSKVNMKVNKNLISFESNGVYVVSRLINGVFPDYRQIIPKEYSTEAVLLKQDLLNALKVSNIFSDKFNHVRIIIDPKGKVFELQTKNSDVGENKTLVDAAITGERIEMNFNYKYIVDCFQSIDADSVSLQLGGMNRPMVIKPVSGDQNFMYLVMPMNR